RLGGIETATGEAEVEVRTRGPAGVADHREVLAGGDQLAGADPDRAVVGVAVDELAPGAADEDRVTVAPAVAGGGDSATGGRDEGHDAALAARAGVVRVVDDHAVVAEVVGRAVDA